MSGPRKGERCSFPETPTEGSLLRSARVRCAGATSGPCDDHLGRAVVVELGPDQLAAHDTHEVLQDLRAHVVFRQDLVEQRLVQSDGVQ